MTIDQLRIAQQRQPFEPYTLCLAGGRRIPVKSPEFVAISPQGRTIGVAISDNAFDVIDVLLVEVLEFGNGEARLPAQGGQAP